MKPACKPLSAERRSSLEARNEMLFKKMPGARAIRDRLLSIDGAAVCLNGDIEGQILPSLPACRIWPVKGCVLKKGDESACHYNSAHLWAEHEHYSLILGWALSNDGVWRPHSFCWDNLHGHVIETTERQQAYFGLALTDAQAVRSLATEQIAKGEDTRNLNARQRARLYTVVNRELPGLVSEDNEAAGVHS